MLQKIYFFLFLLFLTTTLACSSRQKVHKNREDYIETLHRSSCLVSFETFSKGDLYNEDMYNHVVQNYTGLTEPWSIQASIPNGDSGDLILIRDNTEFWVKSFSHEEFYVYKLDSWRTVPRKVAGTDSIIQTLFLASDGTVWGRSSSESDYDVTLLSRLNEKTKRFEDVFIFANQVGQMELDSNDVFWLLTEGGLHTFDTRSSAVTRVVDFPDEHATEMTFTNQGDIYFFVEDSKDRGSPFRSFYPDSFLYFSKETNQLKAVVLSEQPWPRRDEALYATDDQLWINDVGYFDLETETWHPRNSDLADYFSGNASWPSPKLRLIDSYDIYWFSLTRDYPIVGGAWYDPINNKGCMFTRSGSNVIEDTNHNLWVYADGNLYVWRRDG